jgi:hypothetical protein
MPFVFDSVTRSITLVGVIDSGIIRPATTKLGPDDRRLNHLAVGGNGRIYQL